MSAPQHCTVGDGLVHGIQLLKVIIVLNISDGWRNKANPAIDSLHNIIMNTFSKTKHYSWKVARQGDHTKEFLLGHVLFLAGQMSKYKNLFYKLHIVNINAKCTENFQVQGPLLECKSCKTYQRYDKINDTLMKTY